MVRVLMFLIIVAALLLSWKTGILESVRSGAVPELGRECIICGPQPEQGVPVAVEPETLAREIETHVGAASSEKVAQNSAIQPLYESGDLVNLPDKTKVKVLDNSSVRVQELPVKIVKVKILSGPSKDAECWVERLNVIDTPIQSIVQGLRVSGKSPGASSNTSAK